MPIYEYKCNQCDADMEVVQKITDAPLKECPNCGGQLRKLISSTSFILKGSGWYVTDYPSKDRQTSMTSEKPAASSETSGKKTDETKSDTAKPDTAKPDTAKPDTATSDAPTKPDTAKSDATAKESVGV
ncbi:MAG: zinc ribbon domain-containing protein [Nitrospirae bacterium]|nr:zinc ribbon domain-containing protein [Nitrospirota bacterium]